MTIMRRLAVLSLSALSLSFVSGCGGGGTPATSVSTASAINFSATGATVTFASTAVGSSAGAQSVTVTNISASTLNFTTVLLTGNNPVDFSMSGTCVGITSLAASQSCSLSVNFTPTAVGTRTAIINLEDTTNTPHQLTLTGTATGAPAPIASFNTNGLVFASVTNGTVTATQGVTLTNTGAAALTGISITLTGTNASNFALPTSSSPCGTTLAVNASCIITADFTAPGSGTYTASVNITDNAAGTPQTISLIGTGAAPVASLTPQNGLTFGTTVVGSPATAQPITLTNTGTAPLTVTSVVASSTNAGDFSETDNCTSGNIAGGSSCTINVGFTPAAGAAGTRTGMITVTDNSSNGTTQADTLTGTAVANSLPTVTVTPSGPLTFTSSTPQVVTVTNTGAVAVSVTGISITGTNLTNFSQTNTCGSSIAVNGTCTVSVTFVPGGASGSFSASLNIADNVSGSPQTVALSGSTAPVATFAPANLTFDEATLSTTTAAQAILLTNTGTGAMTGIAATLTGTGAGSFALTTGSNACGTTLAINASCDFYITFTPTANSTVSASVSVADNAAGTPQTVALTGNGGTSVSSVTTTLVTEFSGGFSSVYSFIDQATSTIDMTMYEDTDTIATTHFISAANRGVRVRIIMDTNGEKSNNTTAYNALNGATITGGGSITVVYANKSFAFTHEKSMIIDAAIPSKAYAGIFTANLSSQYYASSRDFLFYENDANDVAAMETTFNSDFTNGGGTTYSPSGYTPSTGDHLVWSPTNATSAILAVIQGAKHTLTIDEEEMADPTMSAALEAAANSGVVVKTAITTSEGTVSLMNTMKADGITIAEYPGTGTELYIHAKVILADVGFSNETAFLGSENFSNGSLTSNRELGLVFTDAMSSTAQAIITSLNTTLQADVACQSDSHCTFF